MHPIQEKLLNLSKTENLAKLSLREMAKHIGMYGESPQKIKHHIIQLQKKGLLNINRIKGVMRRTSDPGWSNGLLKKSYSLFSIPIIGTANCGPATIFAEQNFEGFLHVSNKLLNHSRPEGLYAIKADGSSMNRARVNEKYIENGDFVIINSLDKEAANNDIVLVIIDGTATIKRFINDKKNNQVILRSDSSFEYDPVYLHPEDDFIINGKVIDVIKK